jgi:hypothetical protein
VRFFLNGGLLAATSALCACSSPSIPSWAKAMHNSHYVHNSHNVIEKRIAGFSHQKKMYVAPTAAHPKATLDESHIGGTLGKSEYLDPASDEWEHEQEIQQRRFDSLLAICRGC